MIKTIVNFIIKDFSIGSKKEKDYECLYNHLKHVGYSEKEVEVIKIHYSFLKVNDDNFYVYEHSHTREVLEITPLGNLCSGRIDLYNYAHHVPADAW